MSGGTALKTEIMMINVGIVPERTNCPEKARALLAMDGAAILRVDNLKAEDAVDGMKRVLGDSLVGYRKPVRIAESTLVSPGERSCFDPETGTVHSDISSRGQLHVDGYMAFGAAYPDMIFLLCERQASDGGDSFILDGLRLVTALAADPSQRDLVWFLWNTPIEQSTPTGIRVLCPTVRQTRGGRLALLCHDDQRPEENGESQAQVHEMLARWHETKENALNAAPRFRLMPGDFLCLDNYRMFHGRNSYQPGGNRLLHRLWCWTKAAFDCPRAADGSFRADIISA